MLFGRSRQKLRRTLSANRAHIDFISSLCAFVVSLSNHAKYFSTEVKKVMGFWVYILKCADGPYYTGHTDNLEKRLGEHQAGFREGYTATRLPVSLAFSQDFPTREEALVSERRIKGWSRKKKEAMIRGDWEEVSRLAKCKDRK